MNKNRVSKNEFVEKVGNFIMKSLKENKSMRILSEEKRREIMNLQGESLLDKEIKSLGFVKKHDKL